MNPVPTWKKIVAFILDFVGSFIIFGYIVAMIAGDTTSNGFELHGTPALIFFISIIAYFVIMNKYLDGTLGKRILGIARK